MAERKVHSIQTPKRHLSGRQYSIILQQCGRASRRRKEGGEKELPSLASFSEKANSGMYVVECVVVGLGGRKEGGGVSRQMEDWLVGVTNMEKSGWLCNGMRLKQQSVWPHVGR